MTLNRCFVPYNSVETNCIKSPSVARTFLIVSSSIVFSPPFRHFFVYVLPMEVMELPFYYLFNVRAKIIIL